MDSELVVQKIESLRRAVERIREKTPADPEVLERDYDLQDIIAVNLQRAIQLSVDVGAHLIADRGLSSPTSMSDTFAVLEQEDVIDHALADRLRRAVGFRNLSVHEYEKIDWKRVHRTVTEHLSDFSDFAAVILNKTNET